MNERIRELLAEAGLFCYDDGTVSLLGETQVGQPEIEKFAELIVKECADIATNRYQRLMDGGKAIKEHFGVEE